MEPSQPAVLGLHHLGIAVSSIDDSLERWVGLGFVLQSVEEVPTEKVRVAVLMAGQTRIELLEPTSPDSPVAKFLDKRGPGVHHLALQTADCGEHIKVLADQGAPMLDKEPRPGAHDCRVAFVHPRHLAGVLVELVEDPHNPPD